MSAKTICILIIAFIVVLTLALVLDVGDFLVGRLFEPRHKKVMLVAAKHDYPKGATITDPEEMFELREFPEFDAPIAAYKDLEEVSSDLVLTNDIHEGQPLQRNSVEPQFAKTVRDFRLEHPPGPGRQYVLITMAKARQGSIQVGTRVDIITSQ